MVWPELDEMQSTVFGMSCGQDGKTLTVDMPPLPKYTENSQAFSVADPDPGSGAFLIPGPQTHIFESLVTIFWVKSSIIL